MVQGKEFYAHKNILYARSEHFKAMLSGGMRESKESVATLSNISSDVFLQLLHFIYTGTCLITPDNVLELFITSDRFILPDLKAKCEGFLSKVISIQNVDAIMATANQLQADVLLNKCKLFVTTSK